MVQSPLVISHIQSHLFFLLIQRFLKQLLGALLLASITLKNKVKMKEKVKTFQDSLRSSVRSSLVLNINIIHYEKRLRLFPSRIKNLNVAIPEMVQWNCRIPQAQVWTEIFRDPLCLISLI